MEEGAAGGELRLLRSHDPAHGYVKQLLMEGVDLLFHPAVDQ